MSDSMDRMFEMYEKDSEKKAAEIVRLAAENDKLKAEADVRDGTWCAENQKEGRGPCGVCRNCLHSRVAYLEQELHDIEKMRCPVCYYPAPENEKEWPNSECVVCTLSAENERLEQQNARLTRELSEAREAIRMVEPNFNTNKCEVDFGWGDLPAVRAAIEEGK